MVITQIAPIYQQNVSLSEVCTDDFLAQDHKISLDQTFITFLDKLSQEIFREPGIREYPELVALAYWLRKGNIEFLISEFRSTLTDKEIVVPRGIVLHFAPSNVDSIFLYSWALSLLAGNSNIVRVSQRQTNQTHLLFNIIRKCFQSVNSIEIAKKNLILTYKHDREINKFLSEIVDVRVLWGGDETIRNIRAFMTKPTAKDIAFSDKFSYCIIKALPYIALNGTERQEIARLFFNDTYWFDQMACSSPRIVYFVGDYDKCEKASQLFWKKVKDELDHRKVTDSMPIAMNKLIFLYECIMEGLDIKKIYGFEFKKPTVVRLGNNDRRNLTHCGGGFFFESFLMCLSDLESSVKPDVQTLTYFGFEISQLNDFARQLGGKGIDRIVPIGQALNFSPVWDGYLLFAELTKRISILS